MPWRFHNKSPVFIQIAERIRGEILCGKYPPESQIPPVRQLAFEASVNPNTMQHALTLLEDEGLIATRGTVGRFVTSDVEALARARKEVHKGGNAHTGCGCAGTRNYSRGADRIYTKGGNVCMSTPVLQCEHLKKSYKAGSPVLEDLNLSLPAGKIIGLLGPNGCGKSTLIKLVSGLLVPDSGKILVCGEEQSEATNSLISYLPERTYFNSWMRVEDLLRYFSEFYADFDQARARQMLADMSIDPSMKLKQLSKGNKEKVQLILVMSRNARLYLLDEPIAGVDPAARDYILQTIIGNYNPEASVVITTHLIHDVEPILEEFLFMGYGGRILRTGVADEVRATEGKTLDELFREVFRYAP